MEGTPLICDVRDVAAAHVLAAETPSASGRYIVSQRTPVTATYLSKVLRVRLKNFGASLTVQAPGLQCLGSFPVLPEPSKSWEGCLCTYNILTELKAFVGSPEWNNLSAEASCLWQEQRVTIMTVIKL